MSGHKGAALLLPILSPARELPGYPDYDSNRFCAELAARGIAACIPSTRSCKIEIPHDTILYRQSIENMFGRHKDRRRVHTRYDKLAANFLSAVAIATLVAFWF